MKLSKENVRSFLIHYQNLNDTESLIGTKGILDYIKKVGCIQYDPLNIVARNADLVLQSRVVNYKPQMLETLLYEERKLIDAWDKQMSIFSSEDWHYFHFFRRQRGQGALNTLLYRKQKDALLCMDAVLDALAKHGPMLPKDINLGMTEAGKGQWGPRSVSAAALDYLFHIGKVGVHKKINVHKVYDLIQNLLPPDVLNQPNPFETEYDFLKWLVYRRIGSVGMLWNRNSLVWLGVGDKKLRQQILDEYSSDGLVTAVEVEGLQGAFYARSKDLLSFDFEKTHTQPSTVRFIAPLDNILWDREMLSKLFDFDYTWEVYTPAEKRKFGYYVLPVLYGNRFIARFEPEKSKTHIKIKNWWWEKDVLVSKTLIDFVLHEMQRFSICFNKSDGIHESVRTIIANA